MFAIIGAAGNVGSSTARALREAGAPVRAILRDAARAGPLEAMGCEIALADLKDPAALTRAIGNAEAVQVIAPLSPATQDPARELRQSIDSLVAALDRARIPRVLAISDYGAHIARDIGMPTLFHGFEARLRELDAQLLILRSAEHMHNWARSIPAALASGTLATFQDPVDMVQPTIAAQDLGRIAAHLLLRPGDDRAIVHAEGPRRYSAVDVATALSQLSGRAVSARAVPRAQWQEAFARIMPASLADLLIKANDAKNEGGLVDIGSDSGEVRRGPTALIDALRPLLPPE